MNLNEKNVVPPIFIQETGFRVDNVTSKGTTDPLEAREIEALLREKPLIAALIQQGLFRRAVDHTGKYFFLHVNEPIE